MSISLQHKTIIGSSIFFGLLVAIHHLYPESGAVEQTSPRASVQESIVPISQDLLRYPGNAREHKHGWMQVARMLKDRPTMLEAPLMSQGHRRLNSSDRVVVWAAEAFDGRIDEKKIDWDARLPTGVPNWVRGMSTSPRPGRNGHIRLAYGSFDELWSCCVFELFNCEANDRFSSLYRAAHAGEMSKDEFVRRATSMEHSAQMKTRAFFGEIWRPWADSSGVKYDPANWRVFVEEDYEEWISGSALGTRAYRDWWASQWDKVARPVQGKK